MIRVVAHMKKTVVGRILSLGLSLLTETVAGITSVTEKHCRRV